MKAVARSAVVSLFLLAPCALAQVSDRDSIPNWPVPATWSPLRPSGAIQTMTDISAAIPFVAISPCRIADTRGGGFTGQAGPPALAGGVVTRTFQVTGTVPGTPAQCGIPTGADAVSFQFTIVQPTSDGNLIAWPAGVGAPNVSVLNWTGGISALGNGTIVPVSSTGAMSVQVNAPTGAIAHLVIDVNGYFSDTLNGQFFSVSGNNPGFWAIAGTNLSSGIHSTAVHGNIGNATPGDLSAGVKGINPGTGSLNFGVWGDATPAGTGVHGLSGTGWGVYGLAEGAAHGAAGVRGAASGTSGNVFGVKGITSSDDDGAAGVKGVSGEGDPLGDSSDCASCRNSGVLGVDASTSVAGGGAGVLGLSRSMAMRAILLGTTGTGQDAGAYLAFRDGALATWAFYGEGNLGTTGTKSFVDPHPTDPSKVIRYVSLEGPEAGTYFRGRGRFQNGLARIAVPEDFRLVTDAEGLTVNVTPIGELATVAVVRMGLDEIVVKSSRNVEFSYMVNGVRKTHNRFTPIESGTQFVPARDDATMPAYLSEGQKAVLISNGTYNADGTVNVDTARRLGWDRVWEERNRPAPQPE